MLSRLKSCAVKTCKVAGAFASFGWDVTKVIFNWSVKPLWSLIKWPLLPIWIVPWAIWKVMKFCGGKFLQFVNLWKPTSKFGKCVKWTIVGLTLYPIGPTMAVAAAWDQAGRPTTTEALIAFGVDALAKLLS